MSEKKGIPAWVVILIIVIVFVVFSNQTQKTTLVEETIVVNYRSYSRYPFTCSVGATVEFEVGVTNGRPIDIYVVDSDDYGNFVHMMSSQSGSFSSIITKKNTLGSRFDFKASRSDTYYLILNNAGRVEGGATPLGDVSVYVKIIG